VGPHSWKKYLYPPYQKLVKSQKIRGGWKLTPEVAEDVKYAFLGVRPCETIALLLSDKVFLTEKFTDVSYKSRRENTLIITVNCTHPADTCFCTSMDAGPEAKSGYDIALTEISYGRSVWYVADEGSEKGVELLKSLNPPLSNESKVQIMEDSLQEASATITRKVETAGLKDDLFSAFDSSRWKETEKRCLTCGNCTMVCPTCFCSTMEDSTNLTGNESPRIRKWDSCFTMDYSYIHGGSIRYSGEARYRNWLTHKFSTWIDQFGDFGCVGCGRCITWCPAGIDVTEEIEAIRTGIVSQLI